MNYTNMNYAYKEMVYDQSTIDRYIYDSSMWAWNHIGIILNIIAIIILSLILFMAYIIIKNYIQDLIEKHKEAKIRETERKNAEQRKTKMEIEEREYIAKKRKSNRKIKVRTIAKRKPIIKTEMPQVEAKPTVSISVYDDKYFYKESELNEMEIEYLLRYQFVKEKFYSINSKKTEYFLLTPRPNEGISHFFVIQDIVEYLKKSKAENIIINATQNPDISFTCFGKKYGIEVETGKVLKSGKMRIVEKVKEMNKNFDDWFFVVTDKNIKKKYQEYADTVDKRGIVKRLSKMRIFVR